MVVASVLSAMLSPSLSFVADTLLVVVACLPSAAALPFSCLSFSRPRACNRSHAF